VAAISPTAFKAIFGNTMKACAFPARKSVAWDSATALKIMTNRRMPEAETNNLKSWKM